VSPFGITFGAAPPTSFERFDNNFAYSDLTPYPHPSFSHYNCLFSAGTGVAKVCAYSEPFENDEYGASARNALQRVEEQLVQKYGEPEYIDILKSGAIYTEPRDWIGSIRYGERTFACLWERGKQKLPDELDSIVLSLGCNDDLGVKLTLAYEGVTLPKVLDEIKARQADVL
jgi:hypothetical protein